MLSRLGADYLDLYQIDRFDYDTPAEETMETLDSLVKAGKVRALTGGHYDGTGQGRCACKCPGGIRADFEGAKTGIICCVMGDPFYGNP